MGKIISKIRDIWAAKDIRSKLLFTGLILLIYRLGAQIPVPYVDAEFVNYFNEAYDGTILQYLNMLSGSALSQATFFALSISPYITASIVIQLLTVAFPKWQAMSKEEDGKKKLQQYTRIATVILAIVTSFAYYRIIATNGMTFKTDMPEWWRAVVIIACFTAGSSIILWLGEKINEHGIGNGISMILFANILSRGGAVVGGVWALFSDWGWMTAVAVIAVLAAIVLIGFVVFITNSERRIPIQYAKRVVGRKMYGGQSTNLPLKLNMSGVMPIIFASSIVSLPATIGMLFFNVTAESEGWAGTFLSVFEATSPVYIVLYIALIIAFSYFYITISFDPIEVSNNLKKNGGTVMGIRPGAPTAAFIKKILNRITLIGAIFLSLIAGLPLVINAIASAFEYTQLSGIAFGGSSLLIVVGVALETYRAIEAQMSMRHYKGFLQ